LDILLLGSVQVFEGDRLLPPFPTQRSRELFAALAIRPNYPHSRAVLAGWLWPEKSEDKARASLNTELWRVRQVLGDADRNLEMSRDSIALNIRPEQVDVLSFRGLIKHGDAPSLKKATELYRGDFMDGCYADWCLLEREQLRDLWQGALEGLLRHHESRGELAEAISFAKRLHMLDPLREEIHRNLMRLYAALGDRPAALAQYQHCRAVLQHELGVSPMPETESLFVRIRQTAPLEDHWQTRQAATRRITEHRLAELQASKKYLPELHISRPVLESRLDEFRESKAAGLILIGGSGCGKTTFLAWLAESRLRRGDFVLLLDASALTLNFRSELTRQLWGSESVSAEEALAALGRDAAAKNQVIWIILDELNAFHDLGAGPGELLRRINALVASVHQQADLLAVKFVLACREYPWRLLTLSNAVNLTW
jgi:DNA-binding SARP family transcriptional activator